MEFKTISNGVFTVGNFMTKEECEEWISFSEQMGYEEAKISMGSQQVMNKSIRNNERLIYDNLVLARELWERIKPFTPKETAHGIAHGLNERFRFYKYFPGQEFKLHQDGSFMRNIHEWSSFTFMIYLNEDMKGGETKFIESVIQPKTGMALIFKHELVHAGLPVSEGVKYVLRTDIMYRRKTSIL